VTRFARRAALAALAAAPVLAVAVAGPALAAESAAAAPAKSTPAKSAPAKSAPAKSAPAKSAPAKSVAVDKVAYENRVVALTNAQRKAHGCGPLRIDGRLVQAARAHSTDMVRRGYFSHTGANGSSFVTREINAGYPKKGPSAENIAWGFRTPQDVVTGWMNSAGHRANILNCGSVAVGVGLAYTAGGSAYWTQDFGRV
jgi:uncharacterized protein YkwD